MEALGSIALILVCGLFADGILTKQKLKELSDRITDIERAAKK